MSTLTLTDTEKWKEFYENRINSSYQNYFEKRYEEFIRQIYALSQSNTIMELGCGIGSVSKAVQKHGKTSFGFDISESMVELANKNLHDNRFNVGNIFETDFPKRYLKVSHGVLEHFSDTQIVSITERCQNSIHYVPLDKYVTPSFGDERLLPYEYWLDLVHPKAYFLFNNDHDLAFIL